MYTEDKKPLGLTPLSSLATDDTFIIGDTSDTDEVVKTISFSNLFTQFLALITASLSGLGDVFGPTSATDNAIARFDATTGKLIQNSGVTIDDTGNLTIGTGGATPNLNLGDSFRVRGNSGHSEFTMNFTGKKYRFRNSSSVTKVEIDADTGATTFSGDVTVPDEAYDATAWNGSLEVPTKNAVRDKIESMSTSSGITRSVNVTSGNVTAGASASTDYVYFVAGAHTVSIPAATSNTNRYTIKNNHSAAITVDTVGAETIDGAASISIAPEDSVDLISNGTNWFIV